MSIEDQINSLNRNEITVLYWKCRGLQYGQIAVRYGKTVHWAQFHMSNVYLKLGFDKSMHSTRRWNILEEKVCPIVTELIGNNSQNLEKWKPKLEESEEIRGLTEPIEVPDTELKPVPEMLALVIYDEMRIEETKEDTQPRKIVREEPKVITIQDRQPPKYGRLVILAVSMCLIVLAVGLVVGYGAYQLGKRSLVPPPAITAVTQVINVLPPTSLPSPISSPTVTFVPTETPTETPLPTETPKPYYNQGEAFKLKDDVIAYLNQSFNAPNGTCAEEVNDFGVSIQVVNQSSNQFLLRFNTNSFHATDDVGTEYSLVGSGMPNYVEKPGLDVNYQMTGGEQRYICVLFKGKIPLKATYLLITADWLSGVGPVTFRKDI